MAITSFTPGFTVGTVSPHKIDWSKGLSLGASNNVSLSNPLGDLNTKPKTGLNLLGNINMGQLATMALPMVTGALKSAANKPLQNMTPEQRLLFEAIYGSGDSVLGDLFNMKQNVQNSINNINNNARTNTGALGSTLALIDSYNSTNFDAFKLNNDKMSFGQGLSRIADSAAKGFSTGMATGNPVIGGILAAASAIGSGARMAFANKNRNTINNAAELALNRTLDSLSLLAKNTQKQMNLMNLANANYAALGGLLDYNIDDKYLANDYMSKLNNRVYKPLFDSMNYFAMGGMPDFNEFNTGGTHELNPNGGIPQGMDKLGVMNTVELGETKTTTPDGDYIFSDRLKLSKEECKKLGIPKNSTYAEASKILRKEYDEMPNDDIAKRGWEQSRDMLILSLEMQKQEIALKEARKQGLNSPKMQGVNPQMLLGMQYSENPQEEALLQQGINPNIPLAFGGYNQYGPGGFLEKVQNLMRSPEMRHAMSNANMARLMRNYENNTKVLGITENKYLEENGVPINEINMNNLLTTPQGDSTWMYTNERINGNNSLFNNINVTNNPLTGNYTYETYNDATGNHVFGEEIPRNELPQEVLNAMNYNYSGNKEHKKGGYVRKFAGGSFLNPNTPPPEKNTHKLTTSDGHTYIYENVPADVYLQMVGNINSENVDIDAVFNQVNNPNRDWDLYLNIAKSRLPEGYVVNTSAAVPVQNNSVVPVNNDPNIDFNGDPEMPDVIPTEDPYRMTRRQARRFMKDYLPFSSMEYKVNPLDGYALFPQPVENTSNMQNPTMPASPSVTPLNKPSNNLVGPLSEDQMPTYGRGNNVFRYYNSDRGFEGSKIYNNEGYDPDYINWLNNTLDFGLYFTEDARNQMLNRYNSTKGTNLNWEDFNSQLLNLGSDNVYGYYTKMLENAYNLQLKSLNTPEVSTSPTVALDTNDSVTNTNTNENNDYTKEKEKQGFNTENLRYAPVLANMIGLAQNLFTPEDYTLPNRLLKEINLLPRVSAPKNTNYMTYNPIDINRHLNQYNALEASTRNAIMNTSNPNRNASLLAAAYNNNIGYGDLALALEAQNQKEKMLVLLYNNSIDMSNLEALMKANQLNLGYDLMRINGIMYELAMRDAIQTARAQAILGNLKGLTDNLSGIAKQAENRRMFDVYMAGQGHDLSMLQRLANGEDINELISEWTAGYNTEERTKFINDLKKNPRYRNYIGGIK